MKKINFTKLALSLALSGFTFFSALAADVYVSSTGDNTAAGTQENPVLTLGKAYELVNGATGSTIYVSGEVNGYTAGTLSDANAICPFNGANFTLTIQGVAGTSPKITGDNKTVRMFRLRSDMVLKLNDLTLTGTPGDTATFEGTCIYMDGGSIEGNNVIFENFKNKANGGVISAAKISANLPLLAFKNCVFRNNACAITGSNTGYGSVLRMNDGVNNGKIYFENCAFLNNNALYGTTFFRQATATSYPTISFVNSTFTGNTNGNGNSGCVTGYSANQTFNIINCTVKGNPTNGSIRFTSATTGNIYNSIIEGNGPFDLNCDNGPVVTVSNSLILTKRNVSDVVYTKPSEYTAVGQLLGTFNAQTNSFTPLQNSLAINFGAKQYLQNLGTDGLTTVNYDQLNNARLLVDDKCDAGSIETVKISTALETGKADNLKIYQSEQKLVIENNMISKVELISISGSVVKTSLTNQLSLTGINKGLYIVKIEVGVNSIIKKVVIK